MQRKLINHGALRSPISLKDFNMNNGSNYSPPTYPINAFPPGAQPNFRLEVTLPKMDFYNVDNVLHVIAAASEPFACGKFCSRCDISGAHEQKRIDIHKYECEGLFNRYRVLRYLCLQMKKLIDLGRFQVWDSEMRQARESPWVSVSRDLAYSDFKNWARASFIFFDDLLVLLAAEKIRANFVIYSTDSDGKITADLCGEEENQGAPALAIDNAPDENRAKSSLKITPAARVGTAEVPRKPPQRFDYLAVEINEILTGDPEMTPALVWRALTAKIGASNTCIVSVSDVGLRWKNVKGDLAIASADNVAERAARWKKART